MKNLLVPIFLFLSYSLFAQENIVNDKNAETRNVSGFSAIKMSGGIDLMLSQGGSEAVAVSAADIKDRERIKTEVKNGVLEIWYEHDKLNLRSNQNKKMQAYVSFKTINKLTASGASDVQVTGSLDLSTLKLNLSGASEFKGKVKIENFDVDMSGASDINIEGAVTTLKIDASGASDMKAFNLTSQDCVVDASGASDVHITVDKTLSAVASGASSVKYKGNAVVNKANSSGASSIKKG